MSARISILSGAWVLLFTACTTLRSGKDFQYVELAPDEFLKEIAACVDCPVIDVRTASEYRKSHISGAVNLSYFGGDLKRRIDSIPKDRTVFIYCQTQHRSPMSARIMKRKGFSKVVDLEGGYVKLPPKDSSSE